jgi:hypothetical protein
MSFTQDAFLFNGLSVELRLMILESLGAGATLKDIMAMEATCKEWKAAVDKALGCWFREQAEGESFSEFSGSAGELRFLRDHVRGRQQRCGWRPLLNIGSVRG